MLTSSRKPQLTYPVQVHIVLLCLCLIFGIRVSHFGGNLVGGRKNKCFEPSPLKLGKAYLFLIEVDYRKRVINTGPRLAHSRSHGILCYRPQ